MISVWVEGKLTETTNDWYAQMVREMYGTWEETIDFSQIENPKEGSWESGGEWSRGGILMLTQNRR